jgi:uncharacterized protein with NRDE domain
MCTLIALHRCVETAPLVVAANRDEYFHRPAEGPALRETAHGRVVAPRDQRAGGTWLGLNEHGVVAAITNRRCEAPDPDRRSRGLIVLDALAARSAREAAEEIEGLAIGAYNPFNLLVADRRSAHLFSYFDRPERIDLAPGAHVIGNVHPGETNSPKLTRQRRELNALLRKPAAGVLSGLAEMCRSHAGDGPFEHTCVHADPYGTRSSTLLRLGDETSELLYADGAPCRAEYRDFTHLLGELDLGSPRAGGQASVRKVS